MSVFLRAMAPLLALGVGTWLGMDRPSIPTAFAEGLRRVAWAADVAEHVAPSFVPPLERQPPTIDAALLPDQPPPWPRLNPQETGERAWLIAEGPAYARHDGRRLVTFTFDDGPFPETAPTVLHLLDQYGIRATFFLIGKYLDGDDHRAIETREWAKRIADAGHLVGNHTFDHRLLTSLPHSVARAQIEDAATAIERAVGRRPLLFRPPYGEVDPWLEGVLREEQLELVLWSIDVEDMKRDDPDQIAQMLEQQLGYKQGGIVLLHDMHWPSVKAFNRLVRWLEADKWDATRPEKPGWAIVDLPEYLRSTAASPQPHANREELERARRAMADRRVAQRGARGS
jgi:peptidoglycan/xylan/chitin deacetylase (PgdA/CDA1 family)